MAGVGAPVGSSEEQAEEEENKDIAEQLWPQDHHQGMSDI